MPVEVMLNTPLADALNVAIQPKLSELGWGSGGPDDSALAEYIVLMIVNGKNQDDIASELSGDFLNLGPDDPGARDFARWLFEQIDVLSAQYEAPSAAAADAEDVSTLKFPPDMAMDGVDVEAELNGAADTAEQLNAPTGPKSMRAGGFRGSREKRIVGQINRALDRSQESVLHRVRGQTGNERISRTPPTGPRAGAVRAGRIPNNNNRAAGIARGMGMGMGPGGPGGPMAVPMPPVMNGANNGNNGNWMMHMPPQPHPGAIMAMLEEQQRVIQQMMMQQGGPMDGGPPNPNQGKSLFERVQRPPHGHGHGPHHFRRGGGQQQHNGRYAHGHPEAAGARGALDADEDTEMSGPKPEETVCKFNLACTNKECKYAHQSPAAPAGTTVDVGDVCSFGAACKNRKCVGRHPSPANKAVHQGEQDCKFYPNCQNPRCPFRHPTMPPCRNGGECKVPNCRFTHVKTMCKYRPCTNRFCPFLHDEGQRGTFPDKVWVPGENEHEHVSERRFVDDQAPEDLVLPGGGGGGDVDLDAEQSGIQEVIS